VDQQNESPVVKFNLVFSVYFVKQQLYDFVFLCHKKPKPNKQLCELHLQCTNTWQNNYLITECFETKLYNMTSKLYNKTSKLYGIYIKKLENWNQQLQQQQVDQPNK
jgi:hypothetical protein